MLVPCSGGSVYPLGSIYSMRASCCFLTHASLRLKTNETCTFMFMCCDVIWILMFLVSSGVSYVSNVLFVSLLRWMHSVKNHLCLSLCFIFVSVPFCLCLFFLSIGILKLIVFVNVFLLFESTTLVMLFFVGFCYCAFICVFPSDVASYFHSRGGNPLQFFFPTSLVISMSEKVFDYAF